MSEYKYHTKTLQHGQLEPYADHVTITQVEVLRKLDHETEFSPEQSENFVKQEALRLCACIPFGDKKMYPWKEEKEWYDTYIDSVEVTGLGVAVVKIVTPYID